MRGRPWWLIGHRAVLCCAGARATRRGGTLAQLAPASPLPHRLPTFWRLLNLLPAKPPKPRPPLPTPPPPTTITTTTPPLHPPTPTPQLPPSHPPATAAASPW